MKPTKQDIVNFLGTRNKFWKYVSYFAFVYALLFIFIDIIGSIALVVLWSLILYFSPKQGYNNDGTIKQDDKE